MKKKRLTKVASIFLATIMVTGLLTGCSFGKDTSSNGNASSQSYSEGSEKAAGCDDTLIISYTEDIGDLNPHTYSSSMCAQDWVYEGLTKWEENSVKPALAQSWDISDDGKEYTFNLREDVVYTDGTKFNAENCKRNFDAVLKHKKDHSWLEMLNQIQKVEAIDEYTVKVTLSNSYYPFLQELTLIRPMRFLADTAFPDGDDTYKDKISAAIGTGMWKLSEHKEGEYALFERNDDYWGELPNFKYLKVEIIPDANTAVNALKSGEIDMIYDISGALSPDAFEELKSSGFSTSISDSMSTLALALNTNRGATKELEVRKALEYGIDKDTIVENVYYNLRKKTETLFDKSLPYCDIETTTYDYDIDKANELLDKAGWKIKDGEKYRTKNGETLLLEYCYISTDTICKTLGEVLQNMYEKIGIEIKLVGEESDSFYNRQKDGTFDIVVSETWGNQYDPHSMVASYREPSHADFRAQEGLPNKKEIDQWVTKLLVETDENARQEYYKNILGSLSEQAVYVPVCTTNILVVCDPSISGIKFVASSFIPLQSVVRNQ